MRRKYFVLMLTAKSNCSPPPSQRSERQPQKSDTFPAGLGALSGVWWSVAAPSLIRLITSVKRHQIERMRSVGGHVMAPTNQNRLHTQAVNKSLAPNSSQPLPKINPNISFNLENRGIWKSAARDPVWRFLARAFPKARTSLSESRLIPLILRAINQETAWNTHLRNSPYNS